jgi:hypothetical protein
MAPVVVLLVVLPEELLEVLPEVLLEALLVLDGVVVSVTPLLLPPQAPSRTVRLIASRARIKELSCVCIYICLYLIVSKLSALCVQPLMPVV